MLILFLGSDYHAIKPMLGSPSSANSTEKHHAIIVAQQAVFQLYSVLDELNGRTDTLIYVIKRDLQASGLLADFAGHNKINIIEFEEFVTLSTQHIPCITLQ
jgi:sulfur transfer complex TusBCD TusB component (DsrH family)